MGKWTDALPSYQQAKGVLHNGQGSCCLGVRYFVEGFTPEYDTIDGIYRFEHNEEVPDVSRLGEWGLNDELVEDDIATAMKILEDRGYTETAIEIGTMDTILGYKQFDLLTRLNDSEDGVTFEIIAEVIDALGWDNS